MESAPVGPWEIANRVARAFFLLAAIPVVWLFSHLGLLHSVLFLFLLFMVPRTLVTRGFLLWRKKLAIGWWRNALRKEGRFYTAQFILRAAFWILAAVALKAAIIPVQFERSEYSGLIAMIWIAAALLVVLDALPSATFRWTTFVGFALGAACLLWQLLAFHSTPAGVIVLAPPLKGEWCILHGGRGALFNHHYPHREQRHALDLVRVESDRTFRGDPDKVESYFAWDQDVIAPADGTVARVFDGIPDGAIGGSNDSNPEGNSIVLKLDESRFVLLAHLKQGSVRVAKGESVKAGQVLAKCGNSGNSNEPHLHIQVQSHASVWDDANRTFPIHFSRGIGYLRRNDRPNFGN